MLFFDSVGQTKTAKVMCKLRCLLFEGLFG